jgi:hypothetical protein
LMNGQSPFFTFFSTIFCARISDVGKQVEYELCSTLLLAWFCQKMPLCETFSFAGILFRLRRLPKAI